MSLTLLTLNESKIYYDLLFCFGGFFAFLCIGCSSLVFKKNVKKLKLKKAGVVTQMCVDLGSKPVIFIVCCSSPSTTASYRKTILARRKSNSRKHREKCYFLRPSKKSPKTEPFALISLYRNVEG